MEPTKKPIVYLAIAQMGKCEVCGKDDDLRFGCCFTCCDFVAGELESPGIHRLWDSRNPTNMWWVKE